MSILGRLKGQALFDGAIVFVIVTAVLIFVWASGSRNSGWEIEERVTLDGEQRVESRDVFIHDNGSLALTDTSLVFKSSLLSPRGIFLDGSSKLSLDGSTIESENGQFIVTLFENEDKNPSMQMSDSMLKNCGGIFLKGRSSLKATRSQLGLVFLREKARLTLNQSQVALALTPGAEDVFAGLIPGEGKAMALSSVLGWKADIEASTIDMFRLELYENSTVTIQDSVDIALNFHTSGTLGDQLSIAGNLFKDSPSGEFRSEWFTIFWQNTTFSRLSLVGIGTDSVKIDNARIGDVKVSDTATIEMNGGTIACDSCTIAETGTVTISGTGVEMIPGSTPTLLVTGLGKLTIKNSDIRDLTIVVQAGGSIVLENCQINQDSIEFNSEGVYTIDGVSQVEEK